MDGKLSGRLSLGRHLQGRLSVMPRAGPQPVLKTLVASENGNYYAADESADGYSSVKVDVSDGYKAYLYYRLYITDFTRDSSDGLHFQNIALFLVIGEGGVDLASVYGAEFTAVSEMSGSPASNAFDGNPATIWESDWEDAPDTTGWVQVRLDKPRAAVGFILYTRTQRRDYPHEALLQGSNDGESWDTLSVINETTTSRYGWTKGCHRAFLVGI